MSKKLGYEAAATRKSKRGFASMSPERRREIASMGGKASSGGGRPPRMSEEAK